ncbi:helix-turn-helix transcriptional regulator [Ralstonia sp. TCR112]|uniref:winged helix-turn-helix transcriptional regulator n=1 Tax=Ralstonia sp. TCR112 TaxID=2601730 RepID=UPI0011BF9345|nr:helix-turn-helix domain-containing protein [Ralstonia sp. TCR112]TXD60770.1 helix-turn-helix transcriptional regulator [Ralstonia sp. TCR112]
MRIPEPLPVPAASELVTSMEEPCSIAAAVSIVGEKWTLLVLREAFSGVTRFDEFLRRTGCSSAILSSRLKALVTYGILRRVPYQEPGDRVRDAYRLTRAGVDLLPAIVALMQWGDRYLTPDGEGPILLRDRESGTPIHVALVNALGEPVAPQNSMRERNPRYGQGENAAVAAADTPPANG